MPEYPSALLGGRMAFPLPRREIAIPLEGRVRVRGK